MADWTFDGTNKIIQEPGSGPGDTSVSVAQEIYSAWKRWVQSGNGQFDAAFSVEGGTPIGATGFFTGTTFLLINGWKLRGGDWDHQAILNGNIFSDDGVVTSANPSFNSNIFVNASVNAQGVSSGSGLSNTQATQLTEIYRLLGLDQGNPVTITPNSQQATDIDITIGGDGENTSTLTRQ